MKGSKRKWPIPEKVSWAEARELFMDFHPYGDAGGVGEVWGVRDEVGDILAAWTWQPPPYGAAKAVAPSCPAAVLSLSRMVAVPRTTRDWHISKPLKWLMKKGIDRTRFPVLVTWADEGEGHTGYVYKCSGWQRDGESWSVRYEHPDEPGVRRSRYSNGRNRSSELIRVGKTQLIRFVHRVCELGQEEEHLRAHLWRPRPSKRVWASGNRGTIWVKIKDPPPLPRRAQ